MNTNDDDRLLQLLAFSTYEVCIDEEALDEADLIAFANDALPRERCPEVQGHLARCAYCREILELYRPAIAQVAAASAPPRSTRPRSRVALAMAASVAVATVVAIGALEPRRAGVAYEVAPPRGAVEAKMGEATRATERWSVAVGSTLRFALRPVAAQPVGEDAVAGVFVETPQGTYRRAEAVVEREREDGVTAFAIEVTGHELLLGRGVRDGLVLVVAESDAALDALEGRVTFDGAPGVYAVVKRAIDRAE